MKMTLKIWKPGCTKPRDRQGASGTPKLSFSFSTSYFLSQKSTLGLTQPLMKSVPASYRQLLAPKAHLGSPLLQHS